MAVFLSFVCLRSRTRIMGEGTLIAGPHTGFSALGSQCREACATCVP